jgi:hypothetical protein
MSFIIFCNRIDCKVSKKIISSCRTYYPITQSLEHCLNVLVNRHKHYVPTFRYSTIMCFANSLLTYATRAGLPLCNGCLSHTIKTEPHYQFNESTMGAACSKCPPGQCQSRALALPIQRPSIRSPGHHQALSVYLSTCLSICTSARDTEKTRQAPVTLSMTGTPAPLSESQKEVKNDRRVAGNESQQLSVCLSSPSPGPP